MAISQNKKKHQKIEEETKARNHTLTFEPWVVTRSQKQGHQWSQQKELLHSTLKEVLRRISGAAMREASMFTLIKQLASRTHRLNCSLKTLHEDCVNFTLRLHGGKVYYPRSLQPTRVSEDWLGKEIYYCTLFARRQDVTLPKYIHDITSNYVS